MINCIIALALLQNHKSIIKNEKVTGKFLYEYMGYMEGDFSEGVKRFKLDGRPSDYSDIIIKKRKMSINLDEQIIPELPFTWRDALTQGTTGIVANPPQEILDNVKELAILLTDIVGPIDNFRVNSWYRTPEHNAAVGGASHSSHLLGAAVDLHPQTKTVGQCKEEIKALQNRKLFFEINTTTWVHLDFKHDHDFIA